MPEYKVLIVDYDPRSIQQMRRVLEGQGHEIRVAQDGVAGMDLFQEFQPHLTLIEAMLPKKHGFEVCGEMKQTAHGEHCKVAIITGVYKGRRYRTQAMHQHHADAYFEKPIDDETLSSRIGALLRSIDAPTGSVPADDPSGSATAASAPAPSPGASAANTEAEADINDRLDDLFG